MPTRSQSRHNSPQQEASPVIVEPLRIELLFLEDQFQEDPPQEVSMADKRNMAELLQAPTEGYEDAIVIPEIAANNFELKNGLINLLQNKHFFIHDKEDPHAHIRYFNNITSTMRVPNVPSSSIKLMLFPYSLEGAARIWLEKEPPRSIPTWDDLVSKFINQFFPPSKTTNLRNEITRFQQRFDESFYEAWDRFNDLFRVCPHHGFFELHQLDTFYNALNVNDQDSLNSATGGNFLDKMPRECLKIIESKSKVCQSRSKAVVAKVSTSSSTLAISSEVAELKDLVRALLLDKKNQSSAPVSSSTHALVKAVEPNYVTCGGSGTLPSNTITNPKEELKGITTRSSVAYQGPTIPTPPKVVKQGTEVTKDQVQIPSSQSTEPVQPPVSQSETPTPISEPVVAPVSAPMPNVKSSIPYPSRRDNERRRDQANEQIKKFYEIFKDISFEISFTDALILMPKFASTLKALIVNKEKLSEMARTPMNEHCSTVILNMLSRKLGDPGKFLIPCEFSGMDECLALEDLGTSINLMPFSVWEALLLSKLTPTCMTLELVDRSGELTLHIENEAITYNLDQTVRYSANYNQMTANKIDVIEMACEEYSQEVLGFSDVTASGNPTPHDDPIVSTTSPTLTSFGDSDFLLFEEADAFLGLEDDPNSTKINPFYYDSEGDILLLETILNSEPLPPLPNHEHYFPSFKKELKVCEAKTVKSSVDEPPEVGLKDLPPHLEYAFLEGDNKLSVIIAKELGDEEKPAWIKVLKSHKRAIAWKLSDIQAIVGQTQNVYAAGAYNQG
nr:reverse transcriptase domain-containing protein [Tanacetum cinerariifolium]